MSDVKAEEMLSYQFRDYLELHAALAIEWAWLKIAIQYVMPSSLFISVSKLVRQMWKASLMSSVVLLTTSSNTLILFQSTWQWLFQTSSAVV